MTAITQKIVPSLWFDRQAEEAAKFYTSVFKNSRTGKKVIASKAGFETPTGTGVPERSARSLSSSVISLTSPSCMRSVR